MSMEMAHFNSESAVIGSICVDAACFPIAERLLTVADFLDPMAARAFNAALTLADNCKPIDPVAIAEALGNGGVEYIANCMKSVPSAANIELYCEGVLNNSKRRMMQDIADRLTDNSYDLSADPDDVLDSLCGEIDSVKSNSASVITAAQSIDDWKAYYQRVKDNPEYAFCKTGFYDLDKQLGGGMFRQGMYVVGARPGMGKTTLALNIAENIASADKPVLFVSLEMSRVQIISKRIAMASLLSYTDIMTGRLRDYELKTADSILDRVITRPFAMTDKSSMTVAEILRAAKQVDGLQAVVVDYLGLVRPSEEAQKKPRYEQITEISAGLKAMAKSLDVPVLVLAQLNRESTNRAGSRPQLTDLRDSGAIEQDADAVVLLHRKDYYEAVKDDYTAPDIEEIELIVAKNRHANTGVVKLAWHGKTGKIGEFDTQHDEPTTSADELPF